MPNLFQDPSKSVPQKADSQTVRVNMEEIEIGGRKSHLPAQSKSPDMAIQHVPNADSGR